MAANTGQYLTAPTETSSNEDPHGDVKIPTWKPPISNTGVPYSKDPIKVQCANCQHCDFTTIKDESSCFQKCTGKKTVIKHFCSNTKCRKEVGCWTAK